MADGPGRSVLSLELAERVAAATLVKVAEDGAHDERWVATWTADRERVESDLAGLREHVFASNRDAYDRHICLDHYGSGECPDARRYSDGLRRTAILYGALGG